MIVQHLIAKGANVCTKNRESALDLADSEEVRNLIEQVIAERTIDVRESNVRFGKALVGNGYGAFNVCSAAKLGITMLASTAACYGIGLLCLFSVATLIAPIVGSAVRYVCGFIVGVAIGGIVMESMLEEFVLAEEQRESENAHGYVV